MGNTSMLEKLTKHYRTMENLESGHGFVGGHNIGFYREPGEIIQEEYIFPQGKFTLDSVNDDYYLWKFSRVEQSSILLKTYK